MNICGLFVTSFITAPTHTATLSFGDILFCAVAAIALFPVLITVCRRTTGAKRILLSLLAVFAVLLVILWRLAPVIIEDLIVY